MELNVANMRCVAKATNLEEKGAQRTVEFAEALIEAFDTQDLWDEFGMVKDLVVRFSLRFNECIPE